MIKVDAGSLAGIITIRKGYDHDNLQEITKFRNLILDQGLDAYFRERNFIKYCHIGTGIIAPDPSQTKLDNRIRTSDIEGFADQTGADNTDPEDPYIFRVRTIRFNPDASIGAYSFNELGFGWEKDDGLLFNRALTKDGAGNQAAITVNAGEYVEVEIELRLYIPVETKTGTFTPTGRDTIERTYQVNAAEWENYGFLSYSNWNLDGGRGLYSGYMSLSSLNILPPLFNSFSRTLGSGHHGLFGTASGVIDGTGTAFTRLSLGTNQLPNKDIGGLTIRIFAGQSWNVSFNPPFSKENSDIMRITLTVSVKRKDD